MRRPMIPLTRDIAILDAHTRFTRLEIINDAPLLAAVGTAVDRRIFTIRFHPGLETRTRHFFAAGRMGRPPDKNATEEPL